MDADAQDEGKETEHTLDAEWVLDHQFVRSHMDETPTRTQYEALVFIGYDDTSERYVVHRLDAGGGRYSETLGHGRRDGKAIRFVFEYPDGLFHNTFTWHPDGKSWSCLLESKNAAGEWTTFSEETLRRAK